ncbi:MAG: type VII secretion protein EssC [Peptococcaceae bacterium]|nr:type VII secretion protein EssC [Peptococcaceae bacterium]
MIVTLITPRRIHSIALPEKIIGQYALNDTTDSSVKLIDIEGQNGKWVIKSNRKAILIDDKGQPVRNAVLEPLHRYSMVIRKTAEAAGEKTMLYAEPVTLDRQIYKKYWCETNTTLRIGRLEGNDIIIPNEYVSGSHAQLSYIQGQWSIDDTSANGTFVNGKRVKQQNLSPGDVISVMMGFKVIIGKNYLAFNTPDNDVHVTTNKIKPFTKPAIKPTEQDHYSDNTVEEYDTMAFSTFYRSPQFNRDIEKPTYTVDSPPPGAVSEETPRMLTLGPALTMGMTSVVMTAFTVTTALGGGNLAGATPTLLMSASMLLGSVLWPTLTKKHDKKRAKEKDDLRRQKYKEYLNRLETTFKEECAKQEEILRETYVPLDDCISRIQEMKRNLWERGPGQDNFLKLRIGTGNGKFSANISYSQRRFAVEEDDLQKDLYALCEAPKELYNIPITLSLYEDYISGYVGNRHQIKEFAKGLIFQIAALYSYDEIKLVFLYDPQEERDFHFTKWLPHVWDNDNTTRFIATTPGEVKEISSYLEKEIEHRARINDVRNVEPYYIIFSLSKTLSLRADMLKQIYAQKKNLHISVLTFYNQLGNLPKECSIVAELTGPGPAHGTGTFGAGGTGQTNTNQGASASQAKPKGKIFDKDDKSGRFNTFTPDIYLAADPTALSVKLSRIRLDTFANAYSLPRMITFLGLFGVGKIEHLNPLTRWRDNDPTQSLEAAVGVDTLGGLFKLDLHEKFHGPHGLVAGMTGSGKSEFIITYILSLAVNYHPDELAFILIDYKGGGMAKSFEHLPHTAGIITNLDGNAINRSLVSIQSELKRRQAIFAETSKRLNISNIDIYKYQKLYREQTVTEPLQHLFIISDEFAELKTQQPEFMSQLVSAARIGRSLGVHLILATQKPAGVVDDQIWSNSRFRVCLKVQDKADSQDMLKRPDAAELVDTGRFYLQVGYNELFEMGQSAWAGAPYYPSEKVIVEKDDSIVIIDRNGRPIRAAKPDNRKGQNANPPKQLDAITEYLRTIAAEENIKIRPLWLEPIDPTILLKDTKTKYPVDKSQRYTLNPIIGEYDDPARQRQCPLTLPISAEGNVVVYGSAGNGKTSFLNTVIYSLMQDHTPEEVTFYLLDFSAETLQAFTQAPHVGDVALSFEKEKINNLFKMLNEEVIKRKKTFADYGGDYSSYIKANLGVSTNPNPNPLIPKPLILMPNIIVVINNYSAFAELYDKSISDVTYLSREGTKYGIYFILTALGVNVIRFNLLQNFKQLFTLQLNDPKDYSTVVGRTEGLLPAKHKGRGLVKLDELYEFQIAHITDEPIPFTFIRNQSRILSQSWQGDPAPGVPLLPEVVNAPFLSKHIHTHNPFAIPIGVECDSLKVHAYPFSRSYITLALSTNDEAKHFLYDLACFIAQQCGIKVSVIDVPGTLADKDTTSFTYATQPGDCESVMQDLFDMLLYRNNTYKKALEQNIEPEPFTPEVIIITSYTPLQEAMKSEEILKQKLAALLERGDPKYNIIIILGEDLRKMSSTATTAWYKQHVAAGKAKDGIWVGSGISAQFHMEANKITQDMREEVPGGFGYVMRKGKAVRVKLLWSAKQEEDD